MDMKILIKGAGDLATGIAVRLFNSGYDVLMTEAAIPTTVRRTVAFSRAVYDGRYEVEGIEAVSVQMFEQQSLKQQLEQIQQIQDVGKIPVIVDESADIRSEYKPDVMVDAILAKKNLGTSITDAPFVIGVGPGFTAGEDVHAVVETKRGHDLGRVIYHGSAIPNTGIPGDVGGYTIERLLKAEVNGMFYPLVNIGDYVEKGQTVAEVALSAEQGRKPINAQITGIVRGMLQEGVYVTEGMKVGDVDARCEIAHCYTVSDKARAIGGGVLEAIVAFQQKTNLNCECG